LLGIFYYRFLIKYRNNDAQFHGFSLAPSRGQELLEVWSRSFVH